MPGLMKYYAYFMRYANMSIDDVRELSLDIAIPLFKAISDIIQKENGNESGGGHGTRWTGR